MDTNTDTSLLRRILVVDDEANIVAAVSRELTNRTFGRYLYEVEGYTDPRQALERAKTQSFDAVIADYLMPEMNGLVFLRAFADICPDCAAIVLSAHTDLEALIKMVNQVHIFRFVPKPWHDYFLKGSIIQALDHNRLILENRRLADSVKARNIKIPSLVTDIDHVLVVHDDELLSKRIARELSSRSATDEVFAAIRSEIMNLPPVSLDEDKLRVQVTTSPVDALQLANDRAYSCIISAYALRQMSGIDLLQAFESKQPDCARFLINDGIGMDKLILAMDLAHIYGVIEFPLKEFEMKSMIASALDRRRITMQNRVLSDMLRTLT